MGFGQQVSQTLVLVVGEVFAIEFPARWGTPPAPLSGSATPAPETRRPKRLKKERNRLPILEALQFLELRLHALGDRLVNLSLERRFLIHRSLNVLHRQRHQVGNLRERHADLEVIDDVFAFVLVDAHGV
ncbi:MAG TPA: hypothetical protein VGI81_10690 [Tepidisphaeraceae bacterium]|jgi:hypothetical protein